MVGLRKMAVGLPSLLQTCGKGEQEGSLWWPAFFLAIDKP